LIGGERPGRHNGPELFRIKYEVGPGCKPRILAVGNQTARLVAIGFQQLVGYVVRADDLHHLFQGGHVAVRGEQRKRSRCSQLPKPAGMAAKNPKTQSITH